MAQFRENRIERTWQRANARATPIAEIEWRTTDVADRKKSSLVECDAVSGIAARPVAVPAERLSLAAQWMRLVEIIIAFCRGVGRAKTLHAAARTQLEVAEFSIDNIFDDVSGILEPTTAMLAARIRNTAEPHVRAVG